MASYSSVSLNEDDIPGSSFGTRKPAELGNDALKFWLKCRGDKCKGLKTKAQLLKRVEEYTTTGKDKIIVDPDPNLVYTKRKLCRQAASSSGSSSDHSVNPDSDSPEKCISSIRQDKVKYPINGWGHSLKKMPFFSRAEMDKHVSRTGKSLGGASEKAVPTGLKKAKTFLTDEYLKDIESCEDQRYFYIRCKCYHSFRKSDPPHNVQLALCIVSGEVESSNCTCVAGSLGYCNHCLALMLKACKFSLYGCKNTKELESDCDQNPDQPCTSKLQTWHKKGRGETIFPQPVMDVTVVKTKIEDTAKKRKQGVQSLLYEARNNVVFNSTEEHQFKEAVRAINPQMFLAQISDLGNISQLKETKFGKGPVGSYASYQLTHTESNFSVTVDISSMPRTKDDRGVLSYPRFPLRNFEDPVLVANNLSASEHSLYESLSVDEQALNEIEQETRNQTDSEKWKVERKYRFTASQFHTISHRQRNDEKFSQDIMNPKIFQSRHTAHGIKYEPVAIDRYQKYMHSQKNPVYVFKCGFVVCGNSPILGCSPDGKVIDPNCEDPFGLLEIKCPETKFHVSPLDACTDPQFFCEKVGSMCKLKRSHPYYSQVQGQMGCTGAQWCDFVVYTKKGMSIERIKFDKDYWLELKQKLHAYFFTHFIKYAAAEFAPSCSDPVLCYTTSVSS